MLVSCCAILVLCCMCRASKSMCRLRIETFSTMTPWHRKLKYYGNEKGICLHSKGWFTHWFRTTRITTRQFNWIPQHNICLWFDFQQDKQQMPFLLFFSTLICIGNVQMNLYLAVDFYSLVGRKNVPLLYCLAIVIGIWSAHIVSLSWYVLLLIMKELTYQPPQNEFADKWTDSVYHKCSEPNTGQHSYIFIDKWQAFGITPSIVKHLFYQIANKFQ